MIHANDFWSQSNPFAIFEQFVRNFRLKIYHSTAIYGIYIQRPQYPYPSAPNKNRHFEKSSGANFQQHVFFEMLFFRGVGARRVGLLPPKIYQNHGIYHLFTTPNINVRKPPAPSVLEASGRHSFDPSLSSGQSIHAVQSPERVNWFDLT